MVKLRVIDLSKPKFYRNAFEKLKSEKLKHSTRPFKARGVSVDRCDRCLMARMACMCPWWVSMELSLDIILLYHRNEIFKPTNSGRLVAEVFSKNVYAFEWSRLTPPFGFMDFLEDAQRQCLLVFPSGTQQIQGTKETLKPGKILTLVFLDATWRQARKMAKSPWLNKLSRFELDQASRGQFTVRNASRDGLLSTAEAVAGCLEQLQQCYPSTALRSTFNLFNIHCEHTRACSRPRFDSSDHLSLMGLKTLRPEGVG